MQLFYCLNIKNKQVNSQICLPEKKQALQNLKYRIKCLQKFSITLYQCYKMSLFVCVFKLPYDYQQYTNLVLSSIFHKKLSNTVLNSRRQMMKCPVKNKQSYIRFVCPLHISASNKDPSVKTHTFFDNPSGSSKPSEETKRWRIPSSLTASFSVGEHI